MGGAFDRCMGQENEGAEAAAENRTPSRQDEQSDACGAATDTGHGRATANAEETEVFPATVTAPSLALPVDEGGERHILLVEDDADCRACMKSLLELEGYVVHTAADGAEALKRLRSGLEPGLILLDLMMPGMDGFQFRKEQLRDPKLSAIRVVVYSGHHDANANAALLEPTAYIQKPIDLDSFLNLVSAHCAVLRATA
jgi:CheY-like chemotaxis protein